MGAGLVRQHRLHSLVAYAATLAYAVNLGRRWRTGNRVTGFLLVVSVLGAILVAAAGYLGGELRTVM